MRGVVTLMFSLWVTTHCYERRPNIVLILTDDQDLLFGRVTPIKQVQNLVANKGVTFTNAFVSTPICCPSRSSILSGLDTVRHGTVNNSFSGGCSSLSWQRDREPSTFGAVLHEAGYRTFYAGKYLNQYGYNGAGGIEHVPVGWDWWLGLVGNSRYYNYTLSVNGTARHFTDQYLTNVIQNYSVEFLESLQHAPESFLMVLAPPAPHAPYTPEPKYRGRFEGIKVPRTPNFNTHKLRDRHWLLNMEPSPLPEETVARIDSYYARRLETLLSVDDMVAATINKLEEIGQLDNTFIIYTSDNGYHLGHFALPWDKRQPYETDVRVPLFVRGPGIPAKSLLDTLVVNVDIAPTIIDMAGLSLPSYMDGLSFLPYATHSTTWPCRTHFNIHYFGEGNAHTVSSQCPLVNDNNLSECYPSSSCKCQDSRNNTYHCIRSLNADENSLYCVFNNKGPHHHIEYYNINQDPYQLNNTYSDLSISRQVELEETLSRLPSCSDSSCYL